MGSSSFSWRDRMLRLLMRSGFQVFHCWSQSGCWGRGSNCLCPRVHTPDTDPWCCQDTVSVMMDCPVDPTHHSAPQLHHHPTCSTPPVSSLVFLLCSSENSERTWTVWPEHEKYFQHQVIARSTHVSLCFRQTILTLFIWIHGPRPQLPVQATSIWQLRLSQATTWLWRYHPYTSIKVETHLFIQSNNHSTYLKPGSEDFILSTRKLIRVCNQVSISYIF